MRTVNRERRETEAAARKAALNKNRTLQGFMSAEYLPRAELNQAARTIALKKGIMKIWLAPLAEKMLSDITPVDLENEELRPMSQAGKSPVYIRHALNLVSTLWNMALEMGLVSGENPVSRVKKPETDDQRDRFLTRDEAAMLKLLKDRSQVVHDIAILSLFSGLRVGECLALTWPDVDFETGLIFVKDTKSKRNRHAHLTAEIREMLVRRHQEQTKTAMVFPQSCYDQIYGHVSKYFNQAVNELGLNNGVTDRRQRVVIHTLRHTFASWQVQMGTPLYTVSKLMGHSSIKMTERYAHLAPDTQKAAVMDLEGFLNNQSASLNMRLMVCRSFPSNE